MAETSNLATAKVIPSPLAAVEYNKQDEKIENISSMLATMNTRLDELTPLRGRQEKRVRFEDRLRSRSRSNSTDRSRSRSPGSIGFYRQQRGQFDGYSYRGNKNFRGMTRGFSRGR